MSHASAREHKPHVLPIRIYAAVWASLLVLTVITVRISYFDFGTLNLIVAVVVATIKATLVALFFMHLKYDERFNVIVFVSSVTFLAVFFIFTLADTVERGQVDPLEADDIELVPARPELMRLAGEGTEGHGADAPAAHGPAEGGEAAPGSPEPGHSPAPGENEPDSGGGH